MDCRKTGVIACVGVKFISEVISELYLKEWVEERKCRQF
jgi:hypothetical protein